MKTDVELSCTKNGKGDWHKTCFSLAHMKVDCFYNSGNAPHVSGKYEHKYYEILYFKPLMILLTFVSRTYMGSHYAMVIVIVLV